MIKLVILFSMFAFSNNLLAGGVGGPADIITCSDNVEVESLITNEQNAFALSLPENLRFSVQANELSENCVGSETGVFQNKTIEIRVSFPQASGKNIGFGESDFLIVSVLKSGVIQQELLPIFRSKSSAKESASVIILKARDFKGINNLTITLVHSSGVPVDTSTQVLLN